METMINVFDFEKAPFDEHSALIHCPPYTLTYHAACGIISGNAHSNAYGPVAPMTANAPGGPDGDALQRQGGQVRLGLLFLRRTSPP